jgi:hypothetical protein
MDVGITGIHVCEIMAGNEIIVKPCYEIVELSAAPWVWDIEFSCCGNVRELHGARKSSVRYC